MNRRDKFLAATFLLLLFCHVPAFALDPLANASAVRTIAFHNLPTVTYDVIQSRLSAVRVDGHVALLVVISPDGAIQSIEAPGRWSWSFVIGGRNLHHRLSVVGGHAQYDSDVPMDAPQLGSEHPVFLDTVHDELGLPEVWQRTTTVHAVGAGCDIVDLSGSTILRVRQLSDDVRIGFSATGEPLFYDLRLPVSVPDAQSGGVPTRLIVSRTRRMQLALPAPRPSAITSVMWSPDMALRGVTYQHFVLEMPPRAGTIHSLMMWQCGAYYSCYDDPTAGYTCWWQDQYCNSPDPPPPPPPDTGGGNGGGSTQTPQQQQRNLYVSNGCSPVPDASQFLDRSAYNASGLANYFSFDAFKAAGNDYVIVDQGLVDGLAAMQSELDTGPAARRG